METASSVTVTFFEVHVAKETFKFNAAHFVAHDRFRDHLRGHNYTVSAVLLASERVGADGNLIDLDRPRKGSQTSAKNKRDTFCFQLYEEQYDD